MPENGLLCKLPLTCGTCGHVGRMRGVYMRWCASCGEAICPTCYPASEDALLGRCPRCVAEDRPTSMELAGRRMRQEREERFWAAFLGT